MTLRDDTPHDARDTDALARWLAAEREAEAVEDARAEEADEALAVLFATALPRPAVPPGLSARLAEVADGAAARQARARTPVFGVPRRVLERVAALLLLVVGIAGAVVQTWYREAGEAVLSRLTPGRVLSTAAEAAFTVVQVFVDACETVYEVVQTGLRLSGVAASFAGTLPVTVALTLGLLLATAVFFLLRDLLADERGWTHVELD